MALTQEIIELLKTQTYIPFVGAGASVPVRLKGEDKAAFPDWTGLVRDLLALVVEEKGGPKLRGDEAYRETEVSEIYRVIRHAVEKGHYKAKGSWPKTWADIDMAVKERTTEEAKKEAIDSDGHAEAQSRKEDDDDYLKILDWAQNKVKALSWQSHLEQAFGLEAQDFKLESLELSRAIWDLGSPVAVTTNYDQVLQASCPYEHLKSIDYGNRFTRSQWLAGDLRHPVIWHLHGQAARSDELVLGLKSYERLYGKGFSGKFSQRISELEHLKALSSTNRFLFIGFSLKDPAVLRTLTYISQLFPSKTPHLLLCTDNDVGGYETELKELNVRPVGYKNHGTPLIDLLSEIALITQRTWEHTPLGRSVFERAGRNRAPTHIVSNLRHVAKANDGVLVLDSHTLNFNQLGLENWETLVRGPKLTLPDARWDPTIHKWDWKQTYWQRIISQVNVECMQLPTRFRHDGPTTLHIVASCPQPLGLYLGMQLKRYRAGQGIAIYQRRFGKGGFEAFYWQDNSWAQPSKPLPPDTANHNKANTLNVHATDQDEVGVEENRETKSDLNRASLWNGKFFRSLGIEPVDATSRNRPKHILLTIEAGTTMTSEQKGSLKQQTNAEVTMELQSKTVQGKVTFALDTPPSKLLRFETAHQKFDGVKEAANLIREIGRAYPRATLHLASPTALAFMIALGYQLEQSTLGLESLIYWDFNQGEYYPTIDILSGQYVGDNYPQK